VAAPEEADLRVAIQQAYLDTAKAKLDRTAAAADFVTKAAGGIGTVYTGLLALAYSVSSTTPHPLPARALAPAILLAAAFLLSVVNASFIRSTSHSFNPLPVAETADDQAARLIAFLTWIERRASRRLWALRSAVVALGASVILLPLPFISLSSGWLTALIAVTMSTVGLYLLVELALQGRAAYRSRHPKPPPPEKPVPDALT
jgi:hypothetical protein